MCLPAETEPFHLGQTTPAVPSPPSKASPQETRCMLLATVPNETTHWHSRECQPRRSDTCQKDQDKKHWWIRRSKREDSPFDISCFLQLSTEEQCKTLGCSVFREEIIIKYFTLP